MPGFQPFQNGFLLLSKTSIKMKVRRTMPKSHCAFILVLTAPLMLSTASFAQQRAGAGNPEPTGQSNLEMQFDSHLKRENLRDWMKRLTVRPHHTGSAYGKANAEFI